MEKKTITINLPAWAIKNLQAIKEECFSSPIDDVKTEEEIILEIIGNFRRLVRTERKYCQIVEITDEI